MTLPLSTVFFSAEWLVALDYERAVELIIHLFEAMPHTFNSFVLREHRLVFGALQTYKVRVTANETWEIPDALCCLIAEFADRTIHLSTIFSTQLNAECTDLCSRPHRRALQGILSNIHGFEMRFQFKSASDLPPNRTHCVLPLMRSFTDSNYQDEPVLFLFWIVLEWTAHPKDRTYGVSICVLDDVMKWEWDALTNAKNDDLFDLTVEIRWNRFAQSYFVKPTLNRIVGRAVQLPSKDPRMRWLLPSLIGQTFLIGGGGIGLEDEPVDVNEWWGDTSTSRLEISSFCLRPILEQVEETLSVLLSCYATMLRRAFCPDFFIGIAELLLTTDDLN